MRLIHHANRVFNIECIAMAEFTRSPDRAADCKLVVMLVNGKEIEIPGEAAILFWDIITQKSIPAERF